MSETNNAEFDPEVVSKIDKCRERVLQKEFGPKISGERIIAAKKDVRARLDAAPEDELSSFRISPGKKPVIICLSGTNTAEFYTVTLNRTYRSDSDPEQNEARVSRIFLAPVMELNSEGKFEPSKTETGVINQELELIMFGESDDNTPDLHVNLFQENTNENRRVSINFLGECGINGVEPDQLVSLPDDQKQKMGIFSEGGGFLATREMRENPDDLMNLTLLEQAFKVGEQVSLNELQARSDALKSL